MQPMHRIHAGLRIWNANSKQIIRQRINLRSQTNIPVRGMQLWTVIRVD